MKVSPELHRLTEEEAFSLGVKVRCALLEHCREIKIDGYSDIAAGRAAEKWFASRFYIPKLEPPENLPKQMILAANEADTTDIPWLHDSTGIRRMTAALRVALNDPRVLGKLTREEAGKIRDEDSMTSVIYAVESMIERRKSRLLAETKTPEKRVTIARSECDLAHQVSVWLDGTEKCCNLLREHAEIYRLGLIAQLKEERKP